MCSEYNNFEQRVDHKHLRPAEFGEGFSYHVPIAVSYVDLVFFFLIVGGTFHDKCDETAILFYFTPSCLRF